MQQLLQNGSGGELSKQQVVDAMKRFRIKKQDFASIMQELEKDGLLSCVGRTRNIKFKIKDKLRL